MPSDSTLIVLLVAIALLGGFMWWFAGPFRSGSLRPDQRKFRYVGSVALSFTSESAMFGTSVKGTAYGHLYENGLGRRRIRTSDDHLRDHPRIVAWINGGPLPPLSEVAQSTDYAVVNLDISRSAIVSFLRDLGVDDTPKNIDKVRRTWKRLVGSAEITQ